MKIIFLLSFIFINARIVVFSGKATINFFAPGQTWSYKTKVKQKNTPLLHIISIETSESTAHIRIDMPEDSYSGKQKQYRYLAIHIDSLNDSVEKPIGTYDEDIGINENDNYHKFIKDITIGEEKLWNIPIQEIIRPSKRNIFTSFLKLIKRKSKSKASTNLTSQQRHSRSTPHLGKLYKVNTPLTLHTIPQLKKVLSRSTPHLKKTGTQSDSSEKLEKKMPATKHLDMPYHQSDSSESLEYTQSDSSDISECTESDSSDSSEHIQPENDLAMAKTAFMEIMDLIREDCVENAKISRQKDK